MSGGTKRFVYTRVKRTLYFVAPVVNKNLACLVSIVCEKPSYLCSYSRSISTTIYALKIYFIYAGVYVSLSVWYGSERPVITSR